MPNYLPRNQRNHEAMQQNMHMNSQLYPHPQTSEDEEEITIDLSEFFRQIKRHLISLILVTMICGILAGVLTKFLIPSTYASSGSIFLTPQISESGSVDFNSINSNQKLVNNVVSLLTQNNIMSMVSKEVGLDTAEDAREAIEVTNTPDTELVTITATTEDPELSKAIAVSTIDTFINTMQDTLNVKNIEIVENPKLDYNPVGPNVGRNIVIGAAVGCFAELAWIFVRMIFDNRLKSKEEAEKYLGIPVYAELPDLEEMGRK